MKMCKLLNRLPEKTKHTPNEIEVIHFHLNGKQIQALSRRHEFSFNFQMLWRKDQNKSFFSDFFEN